MRMEWLTKKDSKIGYLKFDISKYDLEKLESAALSLVYNGKASGNAATDSLRVALTETSDWVEGTGNNVVVGDASITWNNKPALNYSPDDLENTC